MNTRTCFRFAVASLVLSVAGITGLQGTAFADEGQNKDKNSPALSAEARAAYPLTTCVISGDVLEDGPMGPPIDYVYRQKGKPDRLVRFCCDSCIDDFNENPQKYLKMIDAAAAARAKSKKPDAHAGHH